MINFFSKKIEAPARVCLRLKKTREEQNLSLEEMEKTTHIAKKYLEAIESCKFTDLPKARAYRIAYIREYAQALGLNPDSVLFQFTKDDGLSDIADKHPHTELKTAKISSFSLLARYAFIGILVVFFVGYMIWQIRGILNPPKLSVFTPLEGMIVSRLNVLVQGETERECQLNINGQNVMANEDGRFETPVDLTNGVNTITISAIKKHGKTTTVTRHVVAKESQTDSLTLK